MWDTAKLILLFGDLRRKPLDKTKLCITVTFQNSTGISVSLCNICSSMISALQLKRLDLESVSGSVRAVGPPRLLMDEVAHRSAGTG